MAMHWMFCKWYNIYSLLGKAPPATREETKNPSSTNNDHNKWDQVLYRTVNKLWFHGILFLLATIIECTCDAARALLQLLATFLKLVAVNIFVGLVLATTSNLELFVQITMLKILKIQSRSWKNTTILLTILLDICLMVIEVIGLLFGIVKQGTAYVMKMLQSEKPDDVVKDKPLTNSIKTHLIK